MPKTFSSINPKIIKKSGACISHEGCLSFPQAYTDVKRYENVMVKALDSNTATLTAVNENQKEMTNTLEKLNYKIENLENKINKGSD